MARKAQGLEGIDLLGGENQDHKEPEVGNTNKDESEEPNKDSDEELDVQSETRFDITLSKKEYALIILLRSMGSGHIEGMDIHNGEAVSVKAIRTKYDFNDPNFVDRLAVINPDENVVFIR